MSDASGAALAACGHLRLRWCLALLVGLVLGGASVSASRAQEGTNDPTQGAGVQLTNIVIIDFQSALSGSNAYAAVQEEAARLRDQFREEFAVLERDLRDVERQLAAERDEIPPEEFNDRRRAFEERVIEAQRAAQERRAALDRATRAANEQIRERVLEIVSMIANEREASLVLARELVVLVNVDIDITSETVARLNAALPSVAFELDVPIYGVDLDAPQ